MTTGGVLWRTGAQILGALGQPVRAGERRASAGPGYPPARWIASIGLAKAIRTWIEAQPGEVVLVSDAPSYDLPLLLNVFDEANEVWPCNTEKRARYYSMDEAAALTYQREFRRIGLPQHHALADAKALRAAWSAHGWPQD